MLPIRLRLTIIFGGLLFLALFFSGTAVITLLRQRLTARLDAALDHRLQGVENFLIRETTAQTEDTIPLELDEYASTQPEGRLIEVRVDSKRVLLKSDPVPSLARVRERVFRLYGKDYTAKAAGSLEPIEESIEEIRFLLLWSTPLLLVLIGLTGYWISSRSLRPVDEMTMAARSIGANNLGGRLAVPPARDELSRLAEAWNETLARLEESFMRMERFTADAAHELRTPLAALRTTAQLSLRRPREPQEYRDVLNQVASISERMNQLAENLLAVARGDHSLAPHAFSRMDLAAILRELAAEIELLTVDRGVTLKLNIQPGPLIMQGEADSLRRLVAALLDNAIKYTPPGGTVSLSLEQDGSEAVVTVADSGCGIVPEELPRVFDRFYRVDPSRDRQTGGYGLGLSIAKQIASAHQGELKVSSVPGQGSTFVLTLPKVREAVGARS
jgi:two-component system heavy metal sensor histidine kinase CusS